MSTSTTSPSFRLDGKVALLTGAARGIGMGVARAFAQAGCSIAIQDIHAQSAHDAASELQSFGIRAVALVGDLADLRHVESLVPSTLQQLGRIDILVNNGAIQQLGFFDGNQSAADIEKQFRVNLTVPLLLTRAVSAHWIQQKSQGRIINISSVQSARGDPEMMPYSMSKAAVDNLTRTSARYLADHQITVNAIAPGIFNTVRNQAFFSDPEMTARQGEWVPLKRHGEPIDAAGAALLFAADAGSYITGQTLFVDGGLNIA